MMHILTLELQLSLPKDEDKQEEMNVVASL